MRVVMTVMSDVVRDARVLREARALQKAGHEVTVFGLRPIDADDLPPLPEGLDIRWIGGSSPFPRGRRPRRCRRLFRAARWALLPVHIRSLERTFRAAVLEASQGWAIDLVHAHDFDTLALGAELADHAEAMLVYDSHEAWLHRRRPGRRTPLQDLRTARTEARLGRRADAVITVSPSLKRWMQKRYGWDHVTVVRNSFPMLAAEPDVPLPVRPRALVYAGRIGRGRDVETLITAAPRLSGLEIVLIGPVDQSFLTTAHRVTFRPAVPVEEVDAVLRHAGLAVVAIADGPLNHRVALPNKLFQAVRAGVPVVAVDLPQLRAVVTKHGLGTLYRPGDPDSFVVAVEDAVERYAELRAAVAAARPALSWAVDGAVLTGLYAQLDDRRRA